MTQKEKGYVGLGVMLVLAAGTVLGSDPLYKAVDSIAAGNVSYTAGTYTGSAQGFGGPVTATVTVTDSGIESVKLDGSGETPELGGAALEKLGPAFVEAGTSKIDGVAGCTITSNAAMEAVQQALDQASGKMDVIAAPVKEEQTEAPAEPAKEEQKEAKAPSDVTYTPGTYEGSAKGFGGEIKAEVVIGDSGVESVKLTGNDETPELGGEALKKLPDLFIDAQSADIDGIAGCTVTSDGAKGAVQAALDQASQGAGATAEPEKEEAKAPSDVTYTPGTYEGSAKGFGGEIKAEVVIGDSGVESVKLTGNDETPELGGEALEKLPDLFIDAQSADIDGVAGCTVTSDGAKAAVQAALDQAQ